MSGVRAWKLTFPQVQSLKWDERLNIDVNKQNEDALRNAPLHTLADYDCPTILEVLLTRGARFDWPVNSKGQTPLDAFQAANDARMEAAAEGEPWIGWNSYWLQRWHTEPTYLPKYGETDFHPLMSYYLSR